MNLLATTGAVIAGAALLASGLSHARSPARFADAIRRQRTVPAGMAPLAAFAVSVSELAVGVLALSGIAVAAPAHARTTMAGAVALYAGFALYSLGLVRFRPDAPCGCSGGGVATTIWVPVRASILALCAGTGFAGASSVGILHGAFEVATVIASSTGLGLIVWLLPDALADPLERTAIDRLVVRRS